MQFNDSNPQQRALMTDIRRTSTLAPVQGRFRAHSSARVIRDRRLQSGLCRAPCSTSGTSGNQGVADPGPDPDPLSMLTALFFASLGVTASIA